MSESKMKLTLNIWKSIPGFENYKISIKGEIVNKEGIIKITRRSSENAAISVSLSIGDKQFTRRVCDLVALTYVDNPHKYKFIRFKDDNELNIYANNIEWTDNPYRSNAIWQPLLGYSKYEVSFDGIRNVETCKPLIPSLNNGYPMVKLCDDNGEQHGESVHILIARQYVHNPDPKTLIEVNHKNGITGDFSILNLEWVTHKQNVQHAVDTGLKSKSVGKCRPIELLDENHNVIFTFNTMTEAGNFIGCTYSNIVHHLKKDKFGDKTAMIKDHRVRYKIRVDLGGEIWKNLNTEFTNINEKYQVSNFGRIKNKYDVLMASTLNKQNYPKISLSNYSNDNDNDVTDDINAVDGVNAVNAVNADDINVVDDIKTNINHDKTFYVHTLVAYAFIEFKGDRKDYEVNHIDKNPKNINLDNLEILLTKEHRRKDHGKKVLCVDKYNNYFIFGSQAEATELFNTKRTNINRAIARGGTSGLSRWYHLDSPEAQEILKSYELKGQSPSIL